MNYKIFILIGILVLIGGGIFLTQREKISKMETSIEKGEKVEVEKEESKTEEKEEFLEEKKKEASEITLISVYDNYQVNPELKTAWGLGLVIETSFEKILFDTGGDSSILLFNMKKLGIDPKSINKVIISHIHEDHLGGLEGFLKENNQVLVYIPSSFPDSVRKMIKSYGANFVDISRAQEISEFVYSTGELYGPPKEQSLVVNSKKGLIVITGCAHPGIVDVVEKAKEIFPQKNIYLVLGGFHHPPRKIVYELKKLKVEKVAPSHCSGDLIIEAFKKEYEENFIKNGVGRIIKIK
ncbi:MAG: MBL fold metallo-hydrolase [Candidatus Nealsonbacteria bacterium]|nr:MAG: MBL fold metallo-hydrolase [Candidatus Nealsonbacteria bacterium]